MPLFTRDIEDRQLVVGVRLGSSVPFGFKEESGHYRALIDTGATSCGIAQDLAARLGIPPIGKEILATAGGVVEVNAYRIDIHVLIEEEDVEVSFRDVDVSDFSGAGGDIAVIIGMDLISQGSLHVSGRHFTFAL